MGMANEIRPQDETSGTVNIPVVWVHGDGMSSAVWQMAPPLFPSNYPAVTSAPSTAWVEAPRSVSRSKSLLTVVCTSRKTILYCLISELHPE